MLTTLPNMLTYIIRYKAYAHLYRQTMNGRRSPCFTILNWGNVGTSKSKWYEECSLIWFRLELATLFVPSCYSSCFYIWFDMECIFVCTVKHLLLVRRYAYDFKHWTDTYDSLNYTIAIYDSMATVLYQQRNANFYHCLRMSTSVNSGSRHQKKTKWLWGAKM